ncbi:MAG: GIY-YIG nuclease family protein [Erysipelotrichaceae bacterium]|nr:GIY-YIG nuclease family protein [Erysipelotrichaceae bacterium]
MNHYVYMIECSDGSYYTGYTNNLKKRLAAHNAGKGAKYTKSRRPVRLIYQENFDNKKDALKREYAIKQLARSEKETLINDKARK